MHYYQFWAQEKVFFKLKVKLKEEKISKKFTKHLTASSILNSQIVYDCWAKNKEGLEHPVFPGGHPSKY